MKRSRSARSSRRRLPSFIDGILRSQMSERTYQTVQPKYVAACWILSKRASGETGEETCGTTSSVFNHVSLSGALQPTIRCQLPTMQENPNEQPCQRELQGLIQLN